MKKTISFFLTTMLLLSLLTACGSNENTSSQEQSTATETQATNDAGNEDSSSQEQSTVAETQATNDVGNENSSSQEQSEFAVGETWTVSGQWELTVTSIEETDARNEYSETNPAAVYIVSYTYNNIGYKDASGVMNGLFFSLDNSIVDCEGSMGYSYPGDVEKYPQETPVGANCSAQVCIGVDHAGMPIKLYVTTYDGNEKEQSATFIVQ